MWDVRRDGGDGRDGRDCRRRAERTIGIFSKSDEVQSNTEYLVVTPSAPE
jgi:hypothetical protein